MDLRPSRLIMFSVEKIKIMMRDNWLKFGCFLSGYNYKILRGCSESSVRRVLRYTSAMLIICILWAFIGYTFSSRYLGADWYSSFVGAFIMIVIVVQIERQVILSNKTNKAPLFFRSIIAVMMGLIGSIIIDQILFKEDIEQQKVLMMGEKVNQILPDRARELKTQVYEIDSVLGVTENESATLSNDIEKHPMITIVTSDTEHFKGPDGRDSTRRIAKTTKIPNPKMELLRQIQNKSNLLRKDKNKKD